MASARHAASSAPLVVPAPGCGRTRKAASPSSATRPNTIRDVSRSKIGWKNGRGSRSKISATCGATSSRACALAQAMTSGRISGGGDGGAVALAGRVGAEVGEPFRGGRPVPDDVVGALAGLGLVVAAGHRIGEEQFARRQAVGVVARTSSRVDRPAECRARRAWRARRHSRRSCGCSSGRNSSRTVERPPSAPIRISPRSREPSAKIAVTPVASCSMRTSDMPS